MNIHGSTVLARISINRKAKKADKTKALSASGSINKPKVETTLYFLAIFPSK